MQREGQENSIYRELPEYVSKSSLSKKNKAKSWAYGYDEKHDIVVISKSGQIGDVIEISGLKIALPLKPSKVYKRSDKHSLQYWERKELPTELSKMQSIFQWNEMPKEFKARWVDYIEQEFDRRDEGFWFMNNGKPCYITGTHYMYLQWS